MAKSRKIAKRIWNKKGAALAYTLIATMVLMILSTSLFTAASYNISLTAKNDDARQSYITCKSAVEYAKSHILQQAQIAKNLNAERENNYKTDQGQAKTAFDNIKKAMAGFSVVRNSDTMSESGLKTVDGTSGTALAKCYTTLSSVVRTTVQTVTSSTAKTGGGFTVSAQNQTVTSKMNDINGRLDDKNNWDTGSMTPGATTASVDSTTEVKNTEILLIRYVFKYTVQISAINPYSASDTRTQQLNYETECQIGSDAAPELVPKPVEVTANNQIPVIFAVGGQYGGAGNSSLLNSNNHDGYNLAPGASSNMPVVFKREIYATGNSGSISAPSVYFMSGTGLSAGLTVGDMDHPKSNGNSATIISNFVYFNGNIQGTKNDQGSWLKLYKRDSNSAGIVQFNNTTITLRHPDNSLTTTGPLNGLYYFNNDDSKNPNDFTDLFDFSSFGSKLQQVPETDYAAISSVANQDYVNYLKSNIDNIVSGEIANGNTKNYQEDFAGWVGQGSLTNGNPSLQKDKTVYCYVSNCQNWGNKLDQTDRLNNGFISCHPYAAKNIIFSLVGNYSLEVSDNRTATFQADYIVMSTNKQAICAESSSSRFIVKSVNEKDPLTMVFPTDTVVQYPTGYWGNTETYTIPAGTYSAVPTGTNLFSSAAETFFTTAANHTYDGMSGIVKYGEFTDIGDKLADAPAPNFLLYGAKYGNQLPVYDNADSPSFLENGKQENSAYPVLFNQPIKIPSDNKSYILRAPQVYLMGAGNSVNGDGSGNATLYSDFIYYAGNSLPWNGNSSLKLHDYNNSKKDGIIYFAQNCTIYKGVFLSLTIPKGYYYFNDGIDLLNLDVQSNYWGSIWWSWWGTYYTNDLSNISQAAIDKIKKANYVDYIKQQHSSVISGDMVDSSDAHTNAPTNAGANWAPNGVLSAGAGGTFSGKDAYLYVDNASTWGSDAANYQAPRINLQYVNADPLTVPAGLKGKEDKVVTFTADDLSLNGQKMDTAQANDTLVLQQGGAHSKFIVRTLDGTGYVNVTLPHDLIVKMSDRVNFYKVPAGVYKVKSGTDLFDYTPNSGDNTITPNKIQIASVDTYFNKGKYTNE